VDDAENRLSRVLSNDSLSDELQIMDYVGLKYLTLLRYNAAQASRLEGSLPTSTVDPHAETNSSPDVSLILPLLNALIAASVSWQLGEDDLVYPRPSEACIKNMPLLPSVRARPSGSRKERDCRTVRSWDVQRVGDPPPLSSAPLLQRFFVDPHGLWGRTEKVRDGSSCERFCLGIGRPGNIG